MKSMSLVSNPTELAALSKVQGSILQTKFYRADFGHTFCLWTKLRTKFHTGKKICWSQPEKATKHSQKSKGIGLSGLRDYRFASAIFVSKRDHYDEGWDEVLKNRAARVSGWKGLDKTRQEKSWRGKPEELVHIRGTNRLMLNFPQCHSWFFLHVNGHNLLKALTFWTKWHVQKNISQLQLDFATIKNY